MITDTQTHPQTHTKTEPITKHCAAASAQYNNPILMASDTFPRLKIPSKGPIEEGRGGEGKGSMRGKLHPSVIAGPGSESVRSVSAKPPGRGSTRGANRALAPRVSLAPKGPEGLLGANLQDNKP